MLIVGDVYAELKSFYRHTMWHMEHTQMMLKFSTANAAKFIQQQQH